MKKNYQYLLFITLLLMGGLTVTNGQAGNDNGINYQAVARDAAGKVLVNKNLTVKMSVIFSNDNTIAWCETHQVATSNLGLFALVIGKGTSTGSGQAATFKDIDWGKGEYKLKVEVDFGTGYINMGENILQSVPYAFQSDKVTDISGHNVTEMIGITDAGSGKVITESERALLVSLGSKKSIDSITVSNMIGAEAGQRETADNALQSGINNEVAARSGADNSIQTALSSETSTRQAADNTLSAKISGDSSALGIAVGNEATARASADNALQTSVSNEASARSGADNTLQTALTSETSERQAADNTVSVKISADSSALGTAIGNEATARTAADNALQTSVSNEASARSGADNTIQTALSSETSSRQAADNALSAKIKADSSALAIPIGNETTARTAADNTLQTAINDEVSARSGADNTLQNAVSAEASARQTSDNTLSAKISADSTALGTAVGNETTARTAADNTLQSSVTGEVTARSAADNMLQGNIDAETTARTNAGNNLQNLIATEATYRTSADNALQSNIDAEAAARTTADGTLQSGINAETSARTSRDAALTDSVSSLRGTINTDRTASNTANSTLQGNIDAETASRTLADNNLQSSVTAEATARQTADAAIQSSVAGEASARTSADNSLQANIDAEAAAGTTADGTLQSAINSESSARSARDAALTDSVSSLRTTMNADRTASNTTSTALQGNIDSEAATRNSADNTLQTNIDNEATIRSTDDISMQTTITSEAATRQVADQALHAKIVSDSTFLKGLIFSTGASAYNNELKLTGNILSISDAGDTLYADLSPLNTDNQTLSSTGNQVSISGGNSITLPLADNSQDGFLTAADWNIFNDKENSLSAGTNAQYYRGDKTWQTLNTNAVAEGSNLYYTDARAQASITGGASTITTSDLPFNRVVISDGSGKVGAASVTSTELGYLSGTTSAVQTQLNGKESSVAAGTSSQYYRGDKSWQTLNTNAVTEGANLYFTTPRVIAAITGGASTIASSNLTASRAVVSDGSGKVGTSTVTSTELGYLSGTTSAIQTQLSGKESTVAAGTTSQYYRGDKSWQTLNTNSVAEGSNLYYTDARAQAAITGGASSISTVNLTANRAAVSDASGKVGTSTVTSTELGYLSGTTSAVQTQLSGKQSNLTNSAGLAGALSDETGTGSAVFSNSPVLVSPTLGAATATSINGNTITTGSGTLTLGAGKTLTSSNTLTLAGTDGSTLNVGTGGTLGTAAYTASTAYESSGAVATHTALTATHGAAGAVVGTTNTQTLTNKTLTSPNINEAVALTATSTKLNYISSATGTSGSTNSYIVFSNSPTLYTPTLGVATATSINGNNITTGSGTLTLGAGKTFTASNTLTLAGTDGSTLNIGTGGTLGTAAYTASTAYESSGTVATHAALTATHGVSGAVVGTTSTQTLTNKTLNSPVLVTPALGVATATSINGNTITTGSGTLTLGAGKTFTASNTLSLTGADGSTLNMGTGGTLGSNAYTSTTYAPLASPTFSGIVTMPSPFTLGATSVATTGTELNYVTGVTSPVQTQLNGKQSTLTNSAGLAAALSDETGTGAAVFATSPTLVTPALGVASATSITTPTLINTAATVNLYSTSTATQTINIGNGITASGSINTINVGTQGAAGSTTSVVLGSTSGTSYVSLFGIIKSGPINRVTITYPATSATLTLADLSSLTTSGSNALTLTTTGTTNATFPVGTRTLASLDGTETFTNKTLTSPVLVTPTLGAASATSINKVIITTPPTTATLTLADNSSFKTIGAYATTFTYTGATTLTLPTTGTLVTLAGSEALTGKTINGLNLISLPVGFTINGGTTTKGLTVNNTLALSGTDGSTLNIGTGGTLGSNAYTSTVYAPVVSPTFVGTVTVPSPFTLGSTSVTSTGTELNYVSGVTSSIQTQLNGKENSVTAGTTAQYYRGDKSWQTLNTTAVTEGSNLYFTNARAQAAITGGASTIASSNLTLNRALVSDASGKVNVAATTATEVSYLSGVTSAIQTQLSGKQSNLTNSAGLAGALSDETGTGAAVFGTSPTISSPVISGGSINNAAIGNSNPSTGVFTTLSASGGITGNLTGTASAIADNAVTSAKIVDGTVLNTDINASAAIEGTKINPNFGSQNIITSGNITATTITATINANSARVINVADPISATDAVNKQYTDTKYLALLTFIIKTADPAELEQAGVTCSDMLSAGKTVAQLVAANVSVQCLVDANADIQQMLTAGLTLSQLYNAGEPVSHMFSASVTLQQVVNAPEIPVSEMISAGYTINGLFGTLTDIDGNTYNWRGIGNQIWMSQSLRTSKYLDGTTIPNVTPDATWVGLTTGAYCLYLNNPVNDLTYGKLYNYSAIIDSRVLAPNGWHVPTISECNTLISYLGGTSVAGGKMKSTGTSLWDIPNTDATNSSGFSGNPGGFRNFLGGFSGCHTDAYFGTTTENGTSNFRCLGLSYATANGNIITIQKVTGVSIRCIRN